VVGKMQWVAYYKDGTIVRQYDKGDLTKIQGLDKEQIRKFKVTEGTGDYNLGLNIDSGKLKFSNLDYMKLQELEGGERLNFIFDKDTTSFKLDRESFDFLDSIVLKKEEDCFFMEFDNRGLINICGRTFRAGYIYKGIDIPFFNASVDNFKLDVVGFTDLYTKSSVPVKAIQGNSSYTLTLNKDYIYEDIKINVNYEIVYDLIRWQSYIKAIFKSNKTLNGKLYVIENEKREFVDVSLYAGEGVSYNKFITII